VQGKIWRNSASNTYKYASVLRAPWIKTVYREILRSPASQEQGENLSNSASNTHTYASIHQTACSEGFWRREGIKCKAKFRTIARAIHTVCERFVQNFNAAIDFLATSEKKRPSLAT
jgi:hypothetical protein